MKKILLWGTGKVANEVLNDCSTLNLYEIVGVIDNDASKWGQIFENLTVYSPEILTKNEGITVVVLTDAFEAIKNQIDEEYKKYSIKVENKYFFYKESLLKRYEKSSDSEIGEVIKYIKENGLDIFNYQFCQNYKSKTNIEIDSETGFYYLFHNGKRMYFPKKFKSKETVCDYYNSILLEQDSDSPHRYLSESFNVREGDVVVDVGVAEGNFAIEVIDRVSKIYLVEADEEWIEALKLTFKDYMDKVVIIKAFISSFCDGNVVTIDSLIKESVDFIKMDIEGNEWDALLGAERVISESNSLRLAICSYHGDFDQELIESYMDKHNIEHWTSKGYMWFPTKLRQTYVSTRLNRGIVFGKKE